ncbi:MAG: hypothetical protein HYY50_01195 [Candidatus Kerfeldbacteria bacterium]|nr:hypothetical protein [Candidatus Kerfeldbacteria bacterium]
MANKRKRVTVRCVGIEPILFNAIPEGLLMDLLKGKSRPKVKGDDVDLDKICEDKLYVDDDGTPCIPRLNMFAALKYAGKFVKAGKKNITGGDSTQLPSILTVEGTLFRLDNGTANGKPEWKMDLRAGRHRQGTSKVMVALVRPRFDRWGFTATVSCADDDATIKTVKQLFWEAGDKAGLGDYRPSSGGFYGRFRPVGFTVEDMVEETEFAAAVA